MSLPSPHYSGDDALESVIDDATHELLTMDLPNIFINPELRTFFKERDTYDNVAAASQLSFPANLKETLLAAEPPPAEFFGSLSQPIKDEKVWAVYALLLWNEKSTSHALYIGSGTAVAGGAYTRINSYVTGSVSPPRLVYYAQREGYQFQSIGMLCSAPLPPAGLVPAVRARFLGLETYFALKFHATRLTTMDHKFQHIVLWPRSSVTWRALCTHLPTCEAVKGSLSLTPEELEIIAALRRKRVTEKASERSQRYRTAKRAEDPEAFKLRARILREGWREKNRDRRNEIEARLQATIIEEKRFFCAVCDIALRSQRALNDHLLCKSHADRVAGIPKPVVTLDRKEARMLAIASNKFRCEACDKSFPNNAELSRHLLRKYHIDRVAGIQKPTVTTSAAYQKEARMRAIASNKFRCEACEKSFSHDIHLRRHSDTARHAKNVEQLKSAL